MLLTKDNLVRFIREKKFVLPQQVSENFETTTIVASATLCELVKDNLVGITNLKLASSPYYYDKKNLSCIIEIGEKHLKSYEREVFEKAREVQVLNKSALSIQHALACERISDFLYPLEIEHNKIKYNFYIWFERDFNKTKIQILDALKGKKDSTNESEPKKRNPQNEKIEEKIVEKKSQISNENFEKEEDLLENYFSKHNLQILSKEIFKKTINYKVRGYIQKISVIFDCVVFFKKPSEGEIISFYTSSQNPKIVFLKTHTKKFEKLFEELENFTLVEI